MKIQQIEKQMEEIKSNISEVSPHLLPFVNAKYRELQEKKNKLINKIPVNYETIRPDNSNKKQCLLSNNRVFVLKT